ncbi:MAG: amidohydrolase family protein [Sphingobacteriaceae bacterium]|nr:amidohydrolase family protein [Sphingobacteriaceae bacterium]
MKNIYYLFLFVFIGGYAQNKKSHFLIFGSTTHIGNGQIIENSVVAVNNGTIEMVGSAKGLKINPKAYDTVYYFEGKHLYPALLNANNILGLHDAEAVRATKDFEEIGILNPHIRALIAYNTDNKIIPTVKTNGVLYTQCTPRNGLISGSSSIMALEGWNWEDAVLKADDGIHVNFPQFRSESTEKEGEQAKEPSKYTETLQMLDKFFTDAHAYVKNGNITEKNIRFEAMRNVLNGKSNLYLHANKAKDILTAIHFAQKHQVKKPVIVGGNEAYKIVKELKEKNIPVMLNRVHDLPDRSDEAVDLMYTLPFLLQKESVLFCLQLAGDMEAAQSRNLPFNAGTAVTYGLSKEEALQSISLNTAKILGVDEWIGSIEEKKLASIVISDGDILDMKSNHITHAWIAGKEVRLTNQQTELYERYKTKYGIK